MKEVWKKTFFWVISSLTVGLLAGILSRQGIQIYGQQIQKPPLSPPEWLFPVVWSILYILMGVGAALVDISPDAPARSSGLNFMVAQLIINFFWPLFFFNVQAFGFSFLWLLLLWGLVLGMILQFWKVAPLAAKLQIPYLLWLSFAAYLNAAVWWLNM